MNGESSFYLTLPSNSSDTTFKKNKPQRYRVELARAVHLDGSWEVALTEIQYPHNWKTISDDLVANVVIPRNDDKGNRMQRYLRKFRDDFGATPRSMDVVRVKAPSGYYANAEEIYEAMMASAKINFEQVDQDPYKEFPISFKINTNSQTGEMLSTNPDSFLERISGIEHLKALGIYDEDKSDDFNSYYYFPIRSAKPFSIQHPTFYVYCDLVRHQLVGNELAPLLRIVAPSGKIGDIISKTFHRPFYVPVSKGYISSVEIKITNEDRKPLKFISGKVVCILHFRKVGSG